MTTPENLEDRSLREALGLTTPPYEPRSSTQGSYKPSEVILDKELRGYSRDDKYWNFPHTD